MIDVDLLKRMYDDFVAQFGEPPLLGGLFDRRLLHSRAALSGQVGRETDYRLSSEQLDQMAKDGLFSWLPLDRPSGDDEFGVPPYVPSRIGLFTDLEQRGWGRLELHDYAEWEEWVIDDCMDDEDLCYNDNDIEIVARQARLELDRIEAEIMARAPVQERTDGWFRRSWSSETAAMSNEDLSARRIRLRTHLEHLRTTRWESAPAEWRHRIGRTAFCIRHWEECVRVMLVESDRAPLRAGFSPIVRFSGEHKLIPDTSRLEEFGVVDWEQTLHSWRLLDDPDHWPIRLPGFVLIGGRVAFDELLTAAVYGERRELFKLDEYVRLFHEVVGGRRCAHCGSVLRRSASPRRRYCSTACSQAARQKTYRRRQKEAVLRHRGHSPRGDAARTVPDSMGDT